MLRNIVFVTSEVSLEGQGSPNCAAGRGKWGQVGVRSPVHGGEAVHTVKGHSLP